MDLLDPKTWDRSIYLDGFTDGGAGDYAVVEPATGAELGRLGAASPDDVDRAARRAKEAQRDVGRAAVLGAGGRAAARGRPVHAPRDEIRTGSSARPGASRPRATSSCHVITGECHEAAALAAAPYGEMLRTERPRLSFSRQLPVGVVGVIAPFNFPLILSMRAVAPALALGNAVVLKPDPRTAVCGGMAIARIFEEAGLPGRAAQRAARRPGRRRGPGHPPAGAGHRLHRVDPRRSGRRRPRRRAPQARPPRARRQLRPDRDGRRRRRAGGLHRGVRLVQPPGPDLHDHRAAHRLRADRRRLRRRARGARRQPGRR